MTLRILRAQIGYPVLIKATAGGGGRGQRMVRTVAALESSRQSAGNEANAAFGVATLYLAKFQECARHIEIQVMGDAQGNVVHLGERECLTQRRRQKLIEEALSPAVDDSKHKARATALRAKRQLCGCRNHCQGAGAACQLVTAIERQGQQRWSNLPRGLSVHFCLSLNRWQLKGEGHGRTADAGTL